MVPSLLPLDGFLLRNVALAVVAGWPSTAKFKRGQALVELLVLLVAELAQIELVDHDRRQVLKTVKVDCPRVYRDDELLEDAAEARHSDVFGLRWRVNRALDVVVEEGRVVHLCFRVKNLERLVLELDEDGVGVVLAPLLDGHEALANAFDFRVRLEHEVDNIVEAANLYLTLLEQSELEVVKK